MKTLPEILKSACTEGREWASGKTLPEIWATCPRGDWMIWLLRCSGAEVSHVQWVKIAIACSEQLAHMNHDPRVKAAIDAAKAWCDAPTEENRRAAADAAAATVYASDAYAAAAAAYAPAAAAYAAAAARSRARKEQADLIRSIIPCPFIQE